MALNCEEVAAKELELLTQIKKQLILSNFYSKLIVASLGTLEFAITGAVNDYSAIASTTGPDFEEVL
jgi:hypothetical protein